MRCTNCRKELMLGSAYCERCGYSALGVPPPDDIAVAPVEAERPSPPRAAPTAPVQHGRRKSNKGNLPTGCGIAIVLAIIATVGGVIVGIIAAVGAIVDSVSGDDGCPSGSAVVVGGTLEPGVSVEGCVNDDEQAEYVIVGAGGTVELSVVGVDDFDPVVTVFGPDDVQIGRDDDGGVEGRDSLLRVDLDGGITYAVVVDGFGGDGGEYELAVTSPVDERELIGVGVPVPGAVEEDQVARYPLDAVAGREVTITVVAVGGFDPTLRVRDADRRELAYNDDADGLDSRLTLVVPPGAVADVEGLNGAEGAYALTVSCVGGSC